MPDDALDDALGDALGDALARLADLDRFCESLNRNDDATAADRLYWWLEAVGVPRPMETAAAAVRAWRAPWFGAAEVTPAMRHAVEQLAAQRGIPRLRLDIVEGALGVALEQVQTGDIEPLPPSNRGTAPTQPSRSLAPESAAALQRLSYGLGMAAVTCADTHAPAARHGAPANPLSTHPEIELEAETERLESWHFALNQLHDAVAQTIRAIMAAAAMADPTPQPIAELWMSGAWPVGLRTESPEPVLVLVMPRAAVWCGSPAEDALERQFRWRQWRDGLLDRYGVSLFE